MEISLSIHELQYHEFLITCYKYICFYSQLMCDFFTMHQFQNIGFIMILFLLKIKYFHTIYSDQSFSSHCLLDPLYLLNHPTLVFFLSLKKNRLANKRKNKKNQSNYQKKHTKQQRKNI